MLVFRGCGDEYKGKGSRTRDRNGRRRKGGDKIKNKINMRAGQPREAVEEAVVLYGKGT